MEGISSVLLTMLVFTDTSILGPWVTQHFGRTLALAESRRPEDRALVPRRILIPLRNPEAPDAIMHDRVDGARD